jgi:retinol dehydrogenase-12
MFSFANISGSNARAFNPVEDIPPLDGKVILVTGGSSGLGKQAITYLAQHNPSRIWLAAQNIEEAETACTDIRQQVPQADLRILPLDLASLDAVKQAAATFSAQSDRLDILMLNAGVMCIPPGLTGDGFEKHFGINHMGHALLTKLLLPLLTSTASAGNDVRVIVVTSYSHWNAPGEGILFDTLRTPAEHLSGPQRYGQSKLANILFARHLASQYPNLTVAAVHPGIADTNLHANATDTRLVDRIINRYLYRFLIYSSIATAAKHQVWAATKKDLRSGEYYEPLGIAGGGRPEGKDSQLAQKLWDWTEAELVKFAS